MRGPACPRRPGHAFSSESSESTRRARATAAGPGWDSQSSLRLRSGGATRERLTTGQQREHGLTRAGLRLIVREDLAVLYVGQRFRDLVGVDGGNELGQLV